MRLFTNFFTIALILFGSLNIFAQGVAINTDGSAANSSAILDASSSSKGVLIPRMSLAERNSIASPATGLLIYQTDNTPGFYFYNGSNWVVIGSEAIDINSLADGSSDGSNLFLGSGAGTFQSVGNSNTGTGINALNQNSSGEWNCAFGKGALENNTSSQNTAVGGCALYSNSGGFHNVAIGRSTLFANANGGQNTVIGADAGSNCGSFISGSVFLGYQAGKNETNSNRLYIENSESSSPLIYGEFDNNKIRINGNFEVSDTMKVEGPSIMTQIAINTDGSDADGSAMLDVKSTTKGFLPPRISLLEIYAIDNPAEGLIVYNTTYKKPVFYDGSYWLCFDGQQMLPPAIGDFIAGGIVFYLDGSGGGLVCAVSDQDGGSGIQWENGSYSTTGATDTAIGSGQANTTTIINSQGAGSYAATVCENYSGGGYNNWFLPSKDELNEMYINKATIDATALANEGTAFVSTLYWSSTEVWEFAWGQHFNDGAQWNAGKGCTYRVRAVRVF